MNDSRNNNKRDNSRDIHRNNTKLLNRMSGFQGIGLSSLGVSIETLAMINLKWSWTVGNNMPIALIVLTLDYRNKCGEVPFDVLPLNVTFNTFVIGIHLVCWSLCNNFA